MYVYMYVCMYVCMFQTIKMRRIQLQSNSRRKRWPLRFGLFLAYVLVQYVTCAKIPVEEVTSPYPSSTDREENWSLESYTLESYTTETDINTAEGTGGKEKTLLCAESVSKEGSEKVEAKKKGDEKEKGKDEEEQRDVQRDEQRDQQPEPEQEPKAKEVKSKEILGEWKEESGEKTAAPKNEPVTPPTTKNLPRTTTVRLCRLSFYPSIPSCFLFSSLPINHPLV